MDARRKFEVFFNSIKQNLVQKSNSKIKESSIKNFIKGLLPPIFTTFLEHFKNRKFGWKGDYVTWDDANSEAKGYDDDVIIHKVKESLLKVKNGEVAFERDSVVFNEIEYSWPLLAGLMLASANKPKGLSVLDFGGSLGSTYYQNKKFLDALPHISWNIVEQKHFVDIGKKDFEDEYLHFYHTVEECLIKENPSVLVLSSVLQYIEKPYEILDGLLNHDFEYILIDRTPFSFDNQDKIKLQVVPPGIYDASYPCWFFNKQFFIRFFISKNYQLIEEFEANDGKRKDCIFKGMILKRND
ncbi:MAG: methyltransferase, TIGR04325 family [Bacteroidetes bacterium HGW-Bacteroidetes-17]|nr:MAG: methyltransferase, TIGR04325 family [Bacteroidetes bacterium HGW-Bacteroidetes-17]